MRKNNIKSEYNIKWCILYALVFCSIINIRAQTSQDIIVAEVGNDKITASGFIKLYELSPHLDGESIDPMLEKVNFLNTLIAYKLWYQNKSRYNVDTSSTFITAKKELRKMFIRDALYRQEILGKINITPAEIANAKLKQEKKLFVNYILSRNEEESKNLLSLLDSGVPFDSVLSVREEYTYQKAPLEINYGDYNEKAEEQLFVLKIGEYTPVIHFRDGYYIFNLKNIVFNQENDNDIYKKAGEVLKNRKEDILYDSFIKSTLNGVKADVDGKLFNILASNLIKEFSIGIKKDSLLHLTISQYASIENNISPEEMNSAFIIISEDSISLKSFLHSAFFTGITMPASDSNTVFNQLNAYVKDYITKEVICQTGEKKGLGYSSAVQEDLQVWLEYYALETIRGRMLDTAIITKEESDSLFRVEGKNDPASSISNGNEIATIKDKIAFQKVNKQIKEKTIELVLGTKVRINYDALQRIELTMINSFTRRNIGFGGTISGAPLYIPNYEWANYNQIKTPAP